MKKHLLLHATERGDAEAQFNLGIMCENGLYDDRYKWQRLRSMDATEPSRSGSNRGNAVPPLRSNLADLGIGAAVIPPS